MEFQATIESSGRTATGMAVPPEVMQALGSGRKPAVRVTIGEHTYRSTVGTMGGRSMLPLSKENRELAGVAAGDVVSVRLELDDQPRTVDLPEDFAAALAGDAAAKRFFDGISYSNQRWHVLNVEGAKTAETRQRRIDKSVGMLAEGRAR